MSDLPINRQIRLTAMWCSLVNLIVIVGEICAFILLFISGLAFFYGFSPHWIWMRYVSNILDPVDLLILLLLGLWILPWKLWQINGNKHPFIDKTVKRALNFTLSCYLYLVIIFALWLGTATIGELTIIPSIGGSIPNDILQVSTINADRVSATPSLSYFDRAFDLKELHSSPQLLMVRFSDPPAFFGRWKPSQSDYDGQPAIIHFLMSAIEAYYNYGLFLMPLVLIFHIGAIVFGSIQAARGNIYKYPLSIYLFK